MTGKIFIETEYEKRFLALDNGGEKEIWEKAALLRAELPTMTGNKYFIYCDFPSMMNEEVSGIAESNLTGFVST